MLAERVEKIAKSLDPDNIKPLEFKQLIFDNIVDDFTVYVKKRLTEEQIKSKKIRLIDRKDDAISFFKEELDKLTYEDYEKLEKMYDSSMETIRKLGFDLSAFEELYPLTPEEQQKKEEVSKIIGEKAVKCIKVIQQAYGDYNGLCNILGVPEEAFYLIFMKATEMFPSPPEQDEIIVEKIPRTLFQGTLFQENFKRIPSSPAFKNFLATIGSGKNIKAFAERRNKHSHSEKLTVKTSEKDTRVAFSYTKGDSNTTVIIDDFSKLGHNAHQRKIALHTLEIANKQCIKDGYMYGFEVSFPLSDIIGENFYKNEDTARKGFIKAGMVLNGASLVGVSISKGKGKDGKKTIKQAETGKLFYHFKVDKNYCYVYLNPQVNWSIIFQNWTILPNYYMRLTDKGCDLLTHIFNQARQNGTEIRRGEGFTISFRNLCDKVLDLPNEEEVKTSPKYQRHYNQYIVKPLMNAIKELQDQNDSGYIVTVHCDKSLPIGQFLDTGYIKIDIPEDSPYYEELIAMSTKQEQIIIETMEKAEKKEIAIQAAIEEKKNK